MKNACRKMKNYPYRLSQNKLWQTLASLAMILAK